MKGNLAPNREYPYRHTVKTGRDMRNYWIHRETGELCVAAMKPSREYERISKAEYLKRRERER